MKGKRKLTALILTAMLTVLMAIPVSAAPAYTPVGVKSNPTFKKYLVMDADAKVPTVTFTYEITGGALVDGTATTLPVYSGKDTNKVSGTVPDEATASFTTNSTTYNTKQIGDGLTLPAGKKYAKEVVSVDLSGVKYNEPGVYRYILTEKDTGVQGITNDPVATRTLDVYVEDVTTATGKALEVKSYVLYSGTVTKAPGKGGELPAKSDTEQEEKSEGYTNDFSAYNLTISKDVAGNQASRDEYFKFTVAITNAHASATYEVDLTNADAETTVNGINTSKLTNAASITTNASGEATVDFWLQNGQSIVIKGLTEGAKYTVSEDADTLQKEGYTASIVRTVGDNTPENAVSASTISDTTGISANTTLAFTNTKTGVIPTGIILSAAGLIVVAIIVVAGIVFFGVRSRRKYEEE